MRINAGDLQLYALLKRIYVKSSAFSLHCILYKYVFLFPDLSFSDKYIYTYAHWMFENLIYNVLINSKRLCSTTWYHIPLWYQKYHQSIKFHISAPISKRKWLCFDSNNTSSVNKNELDSTLIKIGKNNVIKFKIQIWFRKQNVISIYDYGICIFHHLKYLTIYLQSTYLFQWNRCWYI